MVNFLFRNKKQFVLIIAFIFVVFATINILFYPHTTTKQKPSFWQVKSIDTMKYSRDASRQGLTDPNFNAVIDQQIKSIADTGATHVAIDTPYDDEFLPILSRWVSAARKYHLSVWFRGNWSGWERWFEYSSIDRAEHIRKTQAFILNHPGLFQDGDIFSACPECENGGPGDPRMNGDVDGHRKFLIDEYQVTKAAFKTIGKKVASNYDSMNGDVARLIMDPETTKALDGIVVIDHYVGSSEKYVHDIQEIAANSGGKIVLGEFGAPIPDIHGDMTQEQQAAWLHEVFGVLINLDVLAGVNYWTNVGSSTALWNYDGSPRQAVEEIKKVYNPAVITITVKNEAGQNIKATVTSGEKAIVAENGIVSMVYLGNNLPITINAAGYKTTATTINGKDTTIVLEKISEDPLFKIEKWFHNLL